LSVAAKEEVPDVFKKGKTHPSGEKKFYVGTHLSETTEKREGRGGPSP